MNFDSLNLLKTKKTLIICLVLEAKIILKVRWIKGKEKVCKELCQNLKVLKSLVIKIQQEKFLTMWH